MLNRIQQIELQGNKYILMPQDIYDELADILSDHYDLSDLVEQQKRIKSGTEELFPSSVVHDLISGVNPVKVYRKYRGLTQDELAIKSGVSTAQIKKIEADDSDGSLKTIRAIAKVLRVDVSDLV